MNIKIFYKVGFIFSLFALALYNSGCKDDLVGNVEPILPPQTEFLNVPVPNTIDNPYSPIIKLGWRGVSEGALIKGFWVSWKSYYLIQKDSLQREPFFTTDATQEIAFSSADSVNKQIVLVKAVDEKGNIDPVGATMTIYTTRTKPPVTEIIFPADSSTAFLQENTNTLWKGVRIDCRGSSEMGELKDFSIQIDNGAWSEWQTSPVFHLNKQNVSGLGAGSHTVKAISRNNVLVEDPTPAEITIDLIEPSHSKEWLIIDDTKDQTGRTERPSDEQVDQFYDSLLIGIPHDSYDVLQNGMVSKELIGQYKYVLWHSDDYRQTSLPNAVGVLTDYLNTQGRLMISGWNFMAYFEPDGDWTNEIEFYGNFLTEYMHLNRQQTILDASLRGVKIENAQDSTRELAKVNMDKLYSFREGLYRVNNYYDLGAFTKPLYYYYISDTTSSRVNTVVGFGYHNSEYRIVVTGFPVYYLRSVGAAKVFNRAKEYLEEKFPY